jgi:hypothetical protein
MDWTSGTIHDDGWDVDLTELPIDASMESQVRYSFTNVTPIIQTHNILTSHNQTHKNPREPIKKLYIYRQMVYHWKPQILWKWEDSDGAISV